MRIQQSTMVLLSMRSQRSMLLGKRRRKVTPLFGGLGVGHGVLFLSSFLYKLSIILMIAFMISYIQNEHPNDDLSKKEGNGSFLFVSSFSTGAGACPRDASAVSGTHLDTTKTNYIYGRDIDELDIEFQINNNVTTNTKMDLEINTDYKLSIVVKSGTTSSLFRGGLIRVEMTTGTGIFELIPDDDDEITATISTLCSLPAMGVTHADNELKKTLSGIVTFQSTGNVTIDVTVVRSNNDTSSMSAYSTFNRIRVIDPSEVDKTPIPTNIVNTFPPSISPEPTTTFSPTFGTKCNICLLDGYKVSRPRVQFPFVRVITTCGEIERTANAGFLPPDLCSTAQQAVSDNRCICIPPTGDDDTIMVDGGSNMTIPTTPVAVIPSTPTTPVSTTTTGTPAAPVSAPAITSNPVVPTQYPTYTDKCYICNGDPSLVVTAYNTLISISVPSTTTTTTSATVAAAQPQVLTCQQLQTVSQSGRIHPTLCQTFIDAVDATSTNICQCQSVDGGTTPTATGGGGVVPAPSSPSIPSGIKTFAPSISRQPTKTMAPTISVLNVCRGCGGSNRIDPSVILLNKNKVVPYFGHLYTCGELYDFEKFITTDTLSDTCTTYQKVIQQNCGCSTTGTTTLLPPATAPYTTFQPSSSRSPTITMYPSHIEPCYVCGSDEFMISDPTVTVIVYNKLHTCGEIYEGGMKRFLPYDGCTVFTEAAQTSCNCISRMDNDVPPPASDPNSSSSAAVPPLFFLLSRWWWMMFGSTVLLCVLPHY